MGTQLLGSAIEARGEASFLLVLNKERQGLKCAWCG